MAGNTSASVAPTMAGTVQWGTSDTTTYGLIQSMTTGEGGTQKEYKDYQGSTVALVTYDKHKTIQLTAICTSAVTLPEKGTTFEVGGTTYYCTEATKNWSNEDAQSVTLSGRTYPSIATGGGSST